MKQTSDVHELIHSMTKNEKRFFTLSSKLQKGDKIYFRLFKALEKQKVYNENSLKTEYKNEKFIKNLAFNKNHLYNLIIKALVSYHSAKNIDGQIHSLISECFILFRKAMYQKYFKTIAKAKKIAGEHERFGYLVQLLDMEKIIIPKEDIQTLRAEKIYKEVNETADKITNMFIYSNMAGSLLHSFRSYGLNRGNVHEEMIESLVSRREMETPLNAKSTRALDSYYRVKELSATAKARNEEAYQYLLKRYEIVTKNPKPFKDYIIHYPSDILYSLTEASLSLNRPDDAEKYLNEISRSAAEYPSDRDDIEIYSAFARLRINLERGMVTAAVKQIPLLEKALVKYKDKILIDTELSIRYYFIKCRMEEKNYPEALHAVNDLMRHPLLNKRADYESYCRLLNLVIHFELKNFELLKHLIVNTYRYLIKKDKLFKVESLILEFIRRLPGVNKEDDLNFMFLQLAKKLKMLKKDKYEKNAFEYFDFLKWVENRLK